MIYDHQFTNKSLIMYQVTLKYCRVYLDTPRIELFRDGHLNIDRYLSLLHVICYPHIIQNFNKLWSID